MKVAEVDSDASSSDFSSLDELDIGSKQLVDDHDQQDEDILDDALFSDQPAIAQLQRGILLLLFNIC